MAGTLNVEMSAHCSVLALEDVQLLDATVTFLTLRLDVIQHMLSDRYLKLGEESNSMIHFVKYKQIIYKNPMSAS